ncbi:Tad domain-containing protein [Paractinoplanes durhamensis]|uniref:Tad domain-containing protein n=1 Tax=Paractinoplanes durhamensis TaxID=113563 RepID=UPI001941AA83|nr:Tad domain-containing protein [Actinoplanes durhamensis]
MATLLAAILAGGVVFGLGAVVIDIGQLYVEREQLQSGADAASMAVALSCIRGDVCTKENQVGKAILYAKKNAGGDQQADAMVCISNTSCPSPWNTTVTCPPLPAVPAGQSVGQYAEVRTSTVTSTGSTLLPPTFAGALTGGAYTGKKVGTCARVSWGPPVTTKVFALGISLCDWKRMTGNGTVYYGPIGGLLSGLGLYTTIGLPNPTTGADYSIVKSGSTVLLGSVIPSCTTPLDTTVPRGYGWLMYQDLTAPDSSCMMNIAVDDLPRASVLALTALTCVPLLQAYAAAGKAIMVPIYDKLVPSFSPILSIAPQYHIVGFAPFVPTGYYTLLGGLVKGLGSILSGGLTQGLNDVLCIVSACITGYFTKTLVPLSRPTGFGTGQNFGATVIARTG